jgi:hypothetical protein
MVKTSSAIQLGQHMMNQQQQMQQQQQSPAGQQKPLPTTISPNHGQPYLNNASRSMSPKPASTQAPIVQTSQTVQMGQLMMQMQQQQQSPAGQQRPLPMTTPRHQGQFNLSHAPRSMSPMPTSTLSSRMPTTPAVHKGQRMINQPQPQLAPEDQDLLRTTLPNQGLFHLG